MYKNRHKFVNATLGIDGQWLVEDSFQDKKHAYNSVHKVSDERFHVIYKEHIPASMRKQPKDTESGCHYKYCHNSRAF